MYINRQNTQTITAQVRGSVFRIHLDVISKPIFLNLVYLTLVKTINNYKIAKYQKNKK